MDRLVEATLQHGLIPPVVMEFPVFLLEVVSQVPPAKVALLGTDYSSDNQLYFQNFANGDVVTASGTENPDLFLALRFPLGL